MFVRPWKGETYSQTWWTVLQTTIVFLSQTCWSHARPLSHGSHTWGRLVSHKITDEVQNKILTTSAGFWHMMVSWVTSWVRKLYWQYSSCLEQSSVTFVTRTISTFLKQEVRKIENHWLNFQEIGHLYLSPHLHPTTVVLVHFFEIFTFVDDLINVQLISFNHMFIEYFVNVQFNWNLGVWDS